MPEDQLSRVQAEVTAAHARLDAMAERIGGIETSVASMANDVKALLSREPSRLPIMAVGGLLAVTLTILSLVVAPLYTDNSRLLASFTEHASDGHPVWVDNKIKSVDKKHAEEHLEQEEDIGELRGEDDRFESRIDHHESRLSRMEEKFGRVVGQTPQGFHMKDKVQVIDPLIERVNRLEDLLFGKKAAD